jgi:hypothetical protein
MMDQTSHDTPPQHRDPPTQDLSAPLTVNGVPMYPQREWQGLTPEDKRMAGIPLYTDQMSISDAFDVIERILKEKNHDMP